MCQPNDSLFCCIFINNLFTFVNVHYSPSQEHIFYKSDLIPKPGPGGGVVSDVSPPAGSAANLGDFCGPGGGLSPFLRAFIIVVVVSGVKSSCKRERNDKLFVDFFI